MIDIDLHLHTYYSDGTESPTELVRRAAAEGLRTIAVTDHDGIDGVPEAAAAARPLGICVIPGLEFSAEWMYRDDSDRPEMHTMHILGYGIDLASGTLQEKMKEEKPRWTDAEIDGYTPIILERRQELIEIFPAWLPRQMPPVQQA